MKFFIVLCSILLVFSVQVFAQPEQMPAALRYNIPQVQQGAVQPGGFMPALKSLVFGPRIGIESNENIPVSFVEKANVFVPLTPFQVFPSTGIKGFAASAFMGPRVGAQLKGLVLQKISVHQARSCIQRSHVHHKLKVNCIFSLDLYQFLKKINHDCV